MGLNLWWRTKIEDSSLSEDTSWEHEVAWRLIRCHGLRLDEENPRLQHYRAEIDSLIPKYLSEKERKRIKRDFTRIESIALPSVIEILQRGFDRERRVRIRTALSLGLPDKALASRHVRLSYQHRMHPDISRFPREQFYEDDSLIDTANMEDSRRWGYSKKFGTDRRLIWKDVRRSETKRGTNDEEAKEVVRQLDRFLNWSEMGETSDRGYWEIAILTFYRAQERLLRRKVGEFFHRQPRRVFWHNRDGRNPVRIEICTVDRFQGHEADFVMVSLVRTRGVGFLDSPNRLNVALTRARYLVLIIGSRQSFSRMQRARALHTLAVDEEAAPPYVEYRIRKGKGRRREK